MDALNWPVFKMFEMLHLQFISALEEAFTISSFQFHFSPRHPYLRQVQTSPNYSRFSSIFILIS